LELVDKLKHEKLHRIGPFLQLKDVKLQKGIANKPLSQTSNTPPLSPPPTLKSNQLVVQNQPK